ncbi:MAG TPA: GTP cyclohydrolase I, partial [Gemmatimonadaceae bacterium]
MATRLFRDAPVDEISETDRTLEYATLTRRELELLGEDPDREGLLKTPQRVANSMTFLTEGYSSSAEDVVGKGIFKEEHDNMIM